MNLCCIKCLMFTKNRNIKIKRKIHGEINLYCHCSGCNFKMFVTIDEEEFKNRNNK